MIKLDVSRLPAALVAVLVQRGTELPPLQWHLNPSRLSRRRLEEVAADTQLLNCDPLADEGMAAAVRGLLYHWNGWPAEAYRAARSSPEKERTYIGALATRQAGEAAASKSLFQKLDGHPIFKPLGEFAAEEIGLSVAAGLKRLREVIAFGELWEPYAFEDVYEQARAGSLDPAAERIVRTLQCREFELLFAYCFEAATGRPATKPVGSHPPPRPAS